MFASETRGNGSLLERVVDGDSLADEGLCGDVNLRIVNPQSWTGLDSLETYSSEQVTHEGDIG